MLHATLAFPLNISHPLCTPTWDGVKRAVPAYVVALWEVHHYIHMFSFDDFFVLTGHTDCQVKQISVKQTGLIV